MLQWKKYRNSYLVITTFLSVARISVSGDLLNNRNQLGSSSDKEDTLLLRTLPQTNSNRAMQEHFSSSVIYSRDTKSNENFREKYNKRSLKNQQYPEDVDDYEGRLTDSFFKYVKRTKDYDRNEVPWDGEKGSKPVEILMSAYLRKVLTSNLGLSEIIC